MPSDDRSGAGRRDCVNQARAILFDAVGTLIYADPPVARVYCEAGARFGSRRSEEDIQRRFVAALSSRRRDDDGLTGIHRERARWQQLVADVFDDVPAPGGALFEALWQHFALPTSWRVFGDAQAVLAALLRDGSRKIGVASNFDDRLLEVCRGHAPLDAELPIYWSAGIGYSKPRREFFAAIAADLQLPPQQILLVGDDPQADYAGAATQAGKQSCWTARLNGLGRT